VDTATVDFGSMAVSRCRKMTDPGNPQLPHGPIVVTNDGSGINETCWLSCSDSGI